MNRYPIIIHGLFTAPAHKVFGAAAEDLSGRDLRPQASVRLIADSGIEGDRFCQYRPTYDGHVTFFSLEVWREIVGALAMPPTLGPELTRRNIILSGIDLKALYGAPFTIQNIQFMGTGHCAPCLAMNRALGSGARKALRGRGGLRAQVKSSGLLRGGRCDLATDACSNPLEAHTQPKQPSIP